MGLENPKEWATVVRQGEISDEEKDIRRGLSASQMRGQLKTSKQCRDNVKGGAPTTSRANKNLTSRGIKRIMARADKPDTPRIRHRRPRNGFAD